MTKPELEEIVRKLESASDDFVVMIRDKKCNRFIWATSDYNWAAGAAERLLTKLEEVRCAGEDEEQGEEA